MEIVIGAALFLALAVFLLTRRVSKEDTQRAASWRKQCAAATPEVRASLKKHGMLRD